MVVGHNSAEQAIKEEAGHTKAEEAGDDDVEPAELVNNRPSDDRRDDRRVA